MTQATDAALIEPFAAIPGLLMNGLIEPIVGRYVHVDGDLRGKVQTIDSRACPLHLLTGEYDFSCTPDDTQRTAAAIAGARVTIMKELGHFPMSENPGQFRRYIAPVLNEIARQPVSSKQGVDA